MIIKSILSALIIFCVTTFLTHACKRYDSSNENALPLSPLHRAYNEIEIGSSKDTVRSVFGRDPDSVYRRTVLTMPEALAVWEFRGGRGEVVEIDFALGRLVGKSLRQEESLLPTL